MLEHTPHYFRREMVPGPALQALFGTPIPGENAAIAEGLAPAVPAQSTPPASTVIKLLDRAAATFDSDRAAAKDCIARASALLRAEHDRAEVARGGLAPWQMRQVIKHVDAALASTVRTRDCARLTRLSVSHFSRVFKLSFGETFSRYVVRRRTERAQEMMMMTDEQLCQIALSCGFADQSHFSRVYHRQVGSSPAAWRRQRRMRENGAIGPAIDHHDRYCRDDRQWSQMG